MMFNVQALLDTLLVMAQGMASIFIVILIIYASVAIMTRVFRNKKEDQE